MLLREKLRHLYEEEKVADGEFAIDEATHAQTGDCDPTHFWVVVLHRRQHLRGDD